MNLWNNTTVENISREVHLHNALRTVFYKSFDLTVDNNRKVAGHLSKGQCLWCTQDGGYKN